MKNRNRMLACLFFCLVGLMPAVAQTKAERKAQQQEKFRELIESRNFTIEIDRAVPQRGRSIYLTSPYKIRLAGDSIDSYLPYYGRAYSIPYDGGKGLIFEAPVSDYKLSFDKKGRATVSFKTQTNEDRFTYTIRIFDNGTASIQVLPVNRQAISYYGRLGDKEE